MKCYKENIIYQIIIHYLFVGTAASSTIRSRECAQVLENAAKVCPACLTVRHMVVKRNKPAATSIHASTPLSKVNNSVLAAEVVNLRRRQRELQAELKSIGKSVEEGCVEVPRELHTDLQQFYKSVGDKMEPFVQLFWEEQEKAFKLENRGMRWHPMLIKFAIFIRQQSPCVYRCLRDMGIVKLPGESTLRDYTSVFSAAPGFQGQVLRDLQLQAENYDADHRYVCLLHDEMSIKSDLVFDRKSNQLIGYVSPQQFDIQKVHTFVHIFIFPKTMYN